MSNRRSALLLTMAATLAGHSFAQNQTVPAFADAVDGHYQVTQPFGVQGFRTQLLVDVGAVAANGGLLTGLHFRGNRPSLPLAAGSVPNVTVTISQTTAAIGAMSTTFASNITGAQTVVFQGTVTLPAQSAVAPGPLPFNIVIPFSQPFPFVDFDGNLLIDIVANNPAGGATSYYLDAVRAGGSATSFGTGGANPSFDNLYLNATSNPNLISPGNTVEFTSNLSFTTPPGVLALGLSAPATPVSLAPFGAPGNTLYVSPDVLLAHVWIPSFIGYYSTETIALPNSPTMVGVLLYGQSAIFEPAANPLGLVMSNAIEMQIGDAAATLPMQQVNATNPAAASGTMLMLGFGPPKPGATPIQFEGTLF